MDIPNEGWLSSRGAAMSISCDDDPDMGTCSEPARRRIRAFRAAGGSRRRARCTRAGALRSSGSTDPPAALLSLTPVKVQRVASAVPQFLNWLSHVAGALVLARS